MENQIIVSTIMKNIFLCLLAHETQSGVLQNRHLPLSIGLIGEYLKVDNPEYNITLFKRPSLLSEALDQNKPDIVMFGDYMWNEKLSLFYAQAVKTFYPEALVVFGGPNFSIESYNNFEFLNNNRCVDIMIEGDAEIPSKKIALSYFEFNGDIEALKASKIPNTKSITIENNDMLSGDVVDNRIGVGNVSLDELPSPYVSGAMDAFFEDAAIPLLESNRGCPYSCSYCQQGTKYFSKVRYYNHERIGQELQHIAHTVKDKFDMQVVEFTDPNFGMYKNDTEVFKAIRNVQDNYDYPKEVWCSSGKSQPERIINNAMILKENSIMIRAALQSTNETTLKDVARTNLPLEAVSRMASKEVDTYSDIMLGLPSETKESYISGILSVIDQGIDEFSMPQTIILKGTPMEAKSYIEKYDLRTKFRVIPECDGVYSVRHYTARVTETEQVICSTSTMPFDEYLECRKFNLVVMIFHNTRLLRPLYMYMDHANIPRSTLLSEIWNAVKSGNSGIELLMACFVDDNISELFESDQTFQVGQSIEEITSNKIYKNLTTALFRYRGQIIELVQIALHGICPDKNMLQTLSSIVESSLFEDISFPTHKIEIDLPTELKELMNKDHAISSCSEFQNDRIQQLKNLYPNLEDAEMKLAYHLRPANMIKTIRFV